MRKIADVITEIDAEYSRPDREQVLRKYIEEVIDICTEAAMEEDLANTKAVIMGEQLRTVWRAVYKVKEDI